MIYMPVEESVIDTNEYTTEVMKISAKRKGLVLDSQYESIYESINKLAAAVFDAPVAILSLIDEDNSWVWSKIGSKTLTKTPRKEEFWNWVVKKDHYFEVPDTSGNYDVCHPCPTNSPNFRFYVGVHITGPLGEVIGTLCVFDLIPNHINSHQRAILIGLADIVAKAIVVRNHINKSHRNYAKV